MKQGITFLTLLMLVGLVILFGSIFTVNEGSHALVLRLGKLQISKLTDKPREYAPGLHFKLPFITSVLHFDTRLQNLSDDASPKRVLTEEQKYVLVDYYAKWRINDLPLYYKSTLDSTDRANVLLKQNINDELRALFGERTISEVVSGERSDIMAKLKQAANTAANKLGISVTDVRIQGIELPQEVQQSVFQRMSTQREQVATNLRAQGQASAEEIKATSDAQVTKELAISKAQAQVIRAEGDQQASNIYIKAYSQNPNFYRFYKSLLSYQAALAGSNTTMVIDPNSDYFKYLKGVQPTAK
jgi:membrane protease subunit HflC